MSMFGYTVLGFGARASSTPPVIASYGVGNTNHSSTSHSCAAPSGIADGDLLVLIAAHDTNSDVSPTAATPPTGFATEWVAVGSGAHPGLIRIYTKTASSESGSYSWTTASAESSASIMLRITGAGAINGNSNYAGAASATPSTPSYTTTVDSCLVVRVVHRQDGGTGSSLVAATTAIATVYSNSAVNDDENALAASQEVQQAAGATGTLNFTSSNSEEYASTTFAIEPA